jgi:Effector-associated domain 11
MQNIDTNALKILAAEDKISELTKQLLAIAQQRNDQNLLNQVTLQGSRFSEYEQKNIMGVLDAKDAALTKNQIVLALLQIIDGLDENNSLTPNAVQKSNKALIFSVIGIVGLLLIVFLGKQLFKNKEKSNDKTENKTEVSANNSSKKITFPSLKKVVFDENGNSTSYEIMETNITETDDEHLSLTFTISCAKKTSSFYGDVNFWDNSFRLKSPQLNGEVLAPNSGLNEIVPINSSRRGDIRFEIPKKIKEGELLIENKKAIKFSIL